MEALLPTKPASNKRLIEYSLTLYRASFFRVLLLAALLAITTFIPRLISNLIGQDLFADLPMFDPHRLWFLVIDLVAVTFFIALLWRMDGVIKSAHEPLKEDITMGLKKLLYVVTAAILQSLIVFTVAMLVFGLQIILHRFHLLFNNTIGSMLLTAFVFIGQLVLLLYVAALFIFFIPIIAVENKGIINALKRSIKLVWNHGWRTISLQIIPWLFYFLFLVVIKFIFGLQIHIYFFTPADNTIWTTILHVILFTLFIPWVAALLLVQLHDLELRKRLTPKT